MKLTGTCKLGMSGLVERALIEFDISAQTIAIWRTSPADLKDFFTGPKRIWSKRISVRDIEIFSPTTVFSCKRLPPAFLSSCSPSGISIDDGEISKVVAIGEGQVHAMRLDLILVRFTQLLQLSERIPFMLQTVSVEVVIHLVMQSRMLYVHCFLVYVLMSL